MWCGIICANLPNLRAFFSRVYGRAAETKSPAARDLELGAEMNHPKPGRLPRNDSSILVWTVDSGPDGSALAAADTVSVVPSPPPARGISPPTHKSI